MPITYFKTVYNSGTPYITTMDKSLERIKKGVSKVLIDKIRIEKDKDKRNKLKSQLPAICFSGEFSERKANSLIKHSGFICLDFDDVENLEEQKENLIKDKYVYSVFVSPSGNGLKVLVKIPEEPDNHGKYYDSLSKYFEGITADKQCKDVSRVCYESSDPDIYINHESNVWTEIIQDVSIENKIIPKIPISDESKILDNLRVWLDRNYPIVEGQRNGNLFIFAKACNEYGVNKSLTEYYCVSNFKDSDFKESEIRQTIKSAYSDSSIFNTKHFEDSDTINSAKALIRSRKPEEEIKEVLVSKGIEPSIVDVAVDIAKQETSGSLAKFWTCITDKKGKKKYDLIRIDFINFLNQHGFYKYKVGEAGYVFIRVQNNVLNPVEIHNIKAFIFDYVLEYYGSDVYEFMARGVKAYFNKDLFELLPYYNYKQHKSTAVESYFYFLNGVLKIKKGGYSMIDYIDLDGFVWETHIIKRNFVDSQSNVSDFYKFLLNISGGEDQKRLDAFCSAIGFLLHDHKDRAYCPAIILNDENISDNPEGGTGKGIFMKAISNFKRVVTMDGKSFKFDKGFLWQRVSLDTQVINLEDVVKGFDFERLFSVITEGITVEKKGLQEFYIPFEDSPKVCITTNYAVKGDGNSFLRRKFELEFAQHYNKNFTPYNEFGKVLFDDWNDEEWNNFDYFMVSCVMLFLKRGLIEYEHINLLYKRLVSDTCNEFVEWMDNNYKADERFCIKDYRNDFIKEYPERERYTTTRTFNAYLHRYSKYVGVKYEKISSNGVYYGEFQA